MDHLELKLPERYKDVIKDSTIEIVDGNIIITPKKQEFKDGDFIVSKWNGEVSECEWVCILKGDFSKEYYNQYSSLILNGNQKGLLEYEGYCDAHEFTRKATPEECSILLDALEKDGKKWNPETKQIEDILKVGDLAIFWNKNKKEAIVSEILETNESGVPYRSTYSWFNNAIKCTSLEQYINFKK